MTSPKPAASLRIAIASIGSRANQSLIMNPSLGIYGLFNGLYLHIGETGNIRGRLLEQLAEDSPWSARHRPSALAFELASSPYRRPRQQELANELQPLASTRKKPSHVEPR
jgi:hypothetical protein